MTASSDAPDLERGSAGALLLARASRAHPHRHLRHSSRRIRHLLLATRPFPVFEPQQVQLLYSSAVFLLTSLPSLEILWNQKIPFTALEESQGGSKGRLGARYQESQPASGLSMSEDAQFGAGVMRTVRTSRRPGDGDGPASRCTFERTWSGVSIRTPPRNINGEFRHRLKLGSNVQIGCLILSPNPTSILGSNRLHLALSSILLSSTQL